MNDICNEYIKMIKENFAEDIKSIIIYGSNIYNESSSDLDVCLILEKTDKELEQRMISKTLEFHKKFGLTIDEEIPHTNKLIYTVSEVNEALNNPPFYENGKVVIHDIVKSEKFLSSEEMKQRLLINILTTDHLTIGASTTKYEKRAFSIIIDVIKRYYSITNNCESEILECMYKNKYTNAEGEMYLGYKKKYQEKEDYLKKKIHEVLK